MKSRDAVIKDFILDIARSALASSSDGVDLSVPKIIEKCGGSPQIVQHVLKHLELNKTIRVHGNYQGDEDFTVHLLSA